MFKKLGCYIKENVFSIKRCLFANKVHLYVSLIALGIGFLLALGKDYSQISTTNNFVFVIFSGNSSPVPQIIRLTLWLLALYALWFLTSIHFISFCIVGYGGILLTSYLLFSRAFSGITVNSLSGFIYLILYLLPTLAIGFVGYVCALKEVSDLLNYDCNKNCIINVACHQKAIRKRITPIWILTALSITLYWLFFYVILIIFV